MGWLNTVLDIANLGINISNASKLEQMRSQGAAAALVDAIVKELRNQIFNYKQTAERILSREGQVPTKQVTGAIRLVEMQLEQSGISPELFPELIDKEYVMSTFRLVRENSARLYYQLAPAEQQEVQNMISVASRLPDHTYYLDNYQTGQDLLAAKGIHDELVSRNGCLIKGLAIVIIYPLLFVPMGLGAALFGGEGGFSAVGAILGAAVTAVALYYIFRWMQPNRFRKAKGKMDKLMERLDVERFMALNRKYGGDRNRALMAQRQADTMVEAFFGETRVLLE